MLSPYRHRAARGAGAFQRAQAGENHFAERGGILLQESLRELLARGGGFFGRFAGRAKVEAINLFELAGTVGGSARVIRFGENAAIRRGLFPFLLDALPEVARLFAVPGIVHAVGEPFWRRGVVAHPFRGEGFLSVAHRRVRRRKILRPKGLSYSIRHRAE